MKLFSLIADNWRMDGGVAFGVVPKSIWSRKHKPDENNTIEITTRCLLVVQDEQKILIDTGLGDKQNQKYYDVRYREPGISIHKSLEQIGFHADDITDVLFTHLHDDHVGAATYRNEKGEPECVFKNAQYWVSQTHWEWALNPNKRENAAFFKDNLIPLMESRRLQLLKEGDQPFPNISLKLFNGHTRGQIIPYIFTSNHTIVFLGDFIPTESNLPIVYIPSVDIEPLVSLTEKEIFLAEAVEGNYILFFEHDANTECCTLTNSLKGVNAKRTFKLNEIE